MPAGPDEFLLRKRRRGSLKVITSVFRPKSSEERKIKVPLHHQSFVHLSAGGRAAIAAP